MPVGAPDRSPGDAGTRGFPFIKAHSCRDLRRRRRGLQPPDGARRGRYPPDAHGLPGHRRSPHRLSSRSDLQQAGELVADFASAVDAVQCAVAVQEAIINDNAARSVGEVMRFRIGIHVGDIMVQGDDLFGVAARLEALAQPGGICSRGLFGTISGLSCRWSSSISANSR